MISKKGICMSNIIINKEEKFLDQMNEAIEKNKNLSDWDLFKLNYQMKKATMAKDFNELQVLSYLPHINFLDHQIKTAKTVIHEINGRAI